MTHKNVTKTTSIWNAFSNVNDYEKFRQTSKHESKQKGWQKGWLKDRHKAGQKWRRTKGDKGWKRRQKDYKGTVQNGDSCKIMTFKNVLAYKMTNFSNVNDYRKTKLRQKPSTKK